MEYITVREMAENGGFQPVWCRNTARMEGSREP